MKYVIYTRVSDEQQEDGVSPESQLEDCITHTKGANYAHIHDTNKGGLPFDKRARLQDAIDLLDKGDILLAPRLDRLARSVENFALIKYFVQRKGATIEFADGSKPLSADKNICPTEWMQENMLNLLAEYERIVIASRIRRAHKSKREKGQALGFAPYGYRIVKTEDKKECWLEVVPEQMATLEHALELRNNGLKIVEIVSALNDRGMYNSRGTPWKREALSKLLRRSAQSVC